MDTIESALDALRRGEPVIVLDDVERENEADLILAAEQATAERLQFMVRHTSGLICVALPVERLDELDLPLMVPANSESFGTAFTITVDCRHGTTTGISAGDRATTIRALVDPARRPEDFARPGHVFPLRAKPGGVLQRPGHTEAALDLTRLAGLTPAGVLCELVNPDGTMTRGEALTRFAAEHQLVTITIAQVVAFRRRHEKLVRHLSSAPIPTAHGRFVAHAYQSLVDGTEHVALVLGDLAGGPPPPVRLHRECLTGDVFGSGDCDCRLQLDDAMARIADEGRGAIVYLRTGAVPGIGLVANSHEHSIGTQILTDLGVTEARHLDVGPSPIAVSA